MNRNHSSTISLVIAAIVGVLVWRVTSTFSGIEEAWDAPVYWSVGYPFLAVVCFVLGWFARRRAWAFGLIAMVAQSLPMLVPLPDDLSLYPLGLVMLGIVSIPLMIAGLLGSKAKQTFGNQ